MALDDASPQGGIRPNNNAPSNPSSGPSTSNIRMPDFSGLTINKELMHRPDMFTLYFGFGGNKWWENAASERIRDRLSGTWVITGRNPTQDEMDAFTFHASRALYYSRMGIPASCFVGGLWMYRGFVKQVPGRNAAEKLKHFNIMASVQRPNFAALVARAAFKMIFIGTAGGIVSSIVAAYTDVKGLVTDPRLQQWTQDSKSVKEEEIRKRRAFMAHNRDQIHKETMKAITTNSPMDGYVAPPAKYEDPEQYSNYEASGESESQSTSQSQQPSAVPSRSAYGWSRQSQPAPKSESSTDFFLGGRDDDDASPTAPEYRNTHPDGSPMSSWDRIRAQNAASRPQQPARQSPTGWSPSQDQSESDMGPAGARDKYDYERRREKEQAQADFDRMMENERKGSDGPAGRGWGS